MFLSVLKQEIIKNYENKVAGAEDSGVVSGAEEGDPGRGSRGWRLIAASFVARTAGWK